MKIITSDKNLFYKFDYTVSSIADFHELTKVLRRKIDGTQYSFKIDKPQENLLEIKKFIEGEWDFDITLLIDRTSSELLIKVYHVKIENETYITYLQKCLNKESIVVDNKTISILCKLVEEPKTNKEVDNLIEQLKEIKGEINRKSLSTVFNLDFSISPMEVINAYIYNFQYKENKASFAFKNFSNEMLYYLLRKEVKKLEKAYNAYFEGDVQNRIVSNKNHAHILNVIQAFYYVEQRKLKDARLIFTIINKGGLANDLLYKQEGLSLCDSFV